MSVTLNLVAYIDGEVTIDGNEGSATIFVRNGATGHAHRLGDGRGRASPAGARAIGKELWERIGPALSEPCADAAKPRTGVREPMRINAGTPLTKQEAAEATD